MPLLSIPEPQVGGSVQISDDEFEAFRRWIYREAGISLSPAKRALVASRLAKRLRQLGLASYGDYYAYVETGDAAERQELVNCLTTNKTEFFREPHHFRFLRERVFPAIRERATRGGPRRLRIWSAACSTGEEPYTIAITALDQFGATGGWDVRVLASDIDTAVLAKAGQGAYAESIVAPVPPALRAKYFDCSGGLCRVRPAVRDVVTFRRINFMDDVWPIQTTFDVIFCRNALIYFDRPTQDRIVRRLSERLAPGGYLMLGHSEGVAGAASHLKPLGETVYQVREGRAAAPARPAKPSPAPPSSATLPPATAAAPPAVKNIIVGEVFATDSPVEVRTLLGSCVAVCLFDPVAKVGGMNHILLPDGVPHGSDRYAGPAIDALVRRTIELGGDPRRLRAKLFGGAHCPSEFAELPEIGRLNADAVKGRLGELGIPVVAERLGGEQAVRIRFSPDTGRVLVEPLDPAERRRILAAEKANLSRLRRAASPAR